MIEKLNMDCIATLDADVILDRVNTIQKVLHNTFNDDEKRFLEEELCYAQREMMIRDSRWEAHKEWLKRS